MTINWRKKFENTFRDLHNKKGCPFQDSLPLQLSTQSLFIEHDFLITQQIITADYHKVNSMC